MHTRVPSYIPAPMHIPRRACDKERDRAPLVHLPGARPAEGPEAMAKGSGAGVGSQLGGVSQEVGATERLRASALAGVARGNQTQRMPAQNGVWRSRWRLGRAGEGSGGGAAADAAGLARHRGRSHSARGDQADQRSGRGVSRRHPKRHGAILTGTRCPAEEWPPDPSERAVARTHTHTDRRQCKER